MTDQDEANLRWMREDAEYQEHERAEARSERQHAREQWTQRVTWIVPTIAVFAFASVLTISIFHHVEQPDTNPTCDVKTLHLQPGESITLSCPVTLKGHDQDITPTR